MATASELLADLLVEGHEHPVVDRETRFVIDPHTRLISHANPDELFVMQGDHNSERFTFELPRYIDGHDMTLCNRVRVHFNNIDESGETFHEDVAEITDLAVDPEDSSKVICSWLIKRQATQYAGILSFLVQFLCTTGSTHDDCFEVVYEWHTDIFNGVTVKSGRNNSQVIDNPRYINILENWEDRLFGVGDSLARSLGVIYKNAVSDAEQLIGEVMGIIEAKGQATLETIPDDYIETYNNARKALRTRANAIVNTAEGSVISVNDASDDYLRGLRVFGKSSQVSTTGKNLFSGALEYGLWVFSLKTKSVDNNYVKTTELIKVTPGKTYIFSGTAVENFQGNLAFYDEDGYYTGDDKQIHAFDTFTVPSDAHYIAFHMLATHVNSINGTVQLEEGADVTAYEPYSGGVASPSPEWTQPVNSIENPILDIFRKNLIRANYDKSDTYEGMSFVITKGLSEVSLNGMTTKSYGYAIAEGTYLTPGQYTMSVYGLNTADYAYLMSMHTRTRVCDNVRTDSPVTFDVTEAGIYRIDFVFANSTTYTNATVRFQIEAGEICTDYEPISTPQTIAISRTLPGIPVPSGGNYTDENGQQWVCDEIDFERGVYVQRIKTVTLDGSDDEAWMLYDNNAQQGLSFVYYPSTTGVTLYQSSLCDKYRNVNGCWGEPYYGQTGIYSDHTGVTGKYFRPPNTSVNSLETWKLWLAENPLTLVYILKNSIETALSEAELYNFSQLHSNYPNTTVMNDQGAHTELKYNADTQMVFENSFRPTDAQVQAAVDAAVVGGPLNRLSDRVADLEREPMVFFYCGYPYAAERGMEWDGWINSIYNTDGFFVDRYEDDEGTYYRYHALDDGGDPIIRLRDGQHAEGAHLIEPFGFYGTL